MIAALLALTSAPTPPLPVAIQGAGKLTVLYSTDSSSPTSLVPGGAGSRFITFGRDSLWASSDGAHVTFTAITDELPGSPGRHVAVLDGQVVLRNLDAPTVVGSGSVVTEIDGRARVNAAGQLLLSVSLQDGPTTGQRIIRREAGGDWTLIASSSGQIPSFPPGWTHSLSLSAQGLTEAGDAWYLSFNAGAPAAPDDDFVIGGSAVIARVGVTVPTGMLNPGGLPWRRLLSNLGVPVAIDGTGAHYVIDGELDALASTDRVIVQDGAVVIREGFELPGLPGPIVRTASHTAMGPDGRWVASGAFEVPPGGVDDFLVLDGNVVLRSGDPVFPGSAETIRGGFRDVACGTGGRFAYSATSDVSGLFVGLDGERVAYRRSDPVDLDGNGLFDDDVFIRGEHPYQLRLADDDRVYVHLMLSPPANGFLPIEAICMVETTAAVGNSFCVSGPNSTTVNSTGGPSRIHGTGSPVASDNDLTLSVVGLPPSTFGIFLTSTARGFIAAPGGSQGNLCIASTDIGRYSGQILSASPAGFVELTLDLSTTPQPSSTTAVAAGDTRYWQYWHREVLTSSGSPSNYSSALAVTFQ